MNESQIQVIEHLTRSKELINYIHQNYSYSTTLTYYIIGFFGAILAFIFTQAVQEKLKVHHKIVVCIWIILGLAICANFYMLRNQTWDSAKLTQILVDQNNTFNSIPLKYDYYISTNKEIEEMTVSQFVSWLLKNDKEFKEAYEKVGTSEKELLDWQTSIFHKLMRWFSNIITILGMLVCLIFGGKYVYASANK